MSVEVRALVPLVNVASVPRSIEFYQRLGFRLRNAVTEEGDVEPQWASLSSSGAELMISRAGEPVRAAGVLFYLYCDDVRATHDALAAAGVDVGEIEFPFWSPKGEFSVIDPDGYALIISHTGS